MNLNDLLNRARSIFQKPELISPLASGFPQKVQATPPTPQPTPTPNQNRDYRHPLYDSPSYVRDGSGGGLKFDELLSAARQANQKYQRVPVSLLMDKFAIESGGGQFLKQFNGGPGRGPSQFEVPLPDDLARFAPQDFNPMSATDSAMLAAHEINQNRLSRWGTPGGSWGSLDASRRKARDRLTTYYSPEELNQFLIPDFQIGN